MGGIPTEIGGVTVGPGIAAVAVLGLSLAAKLWMSFRYRVQEQSDGYENIDVEQKVNVSLAQLNVAEYEGLFIALLLFFHTAAEPSDLLTAVSWIMPLAQAFYFWGRVLTGKAMPCSPIGALPRYAAMGISIYLLHNTLKPKYFGADYGPGSAAVLVLVLSLAAKMFMSFGYRVQDRNDENVSAAQLNVKEYEALFIAIFLFLHLKKVDGQLVTIISYVVPVAQLVYFWGRVATGKVMPCAPLGALPRYACMIVIVYLFYGLLVDGQEYGPGPAAFAIFALCLAAKLFMSFAVRVPDKQDENAHRAQLNVAEYDDIFLAVFLFFFLQSTTGDLIPAVCYMAPIAQAVYFWGRAISGKEMPWSPLGALTRYACMGMMVYILYGAVNK